MKEEPDWIYVQVWNAVYLLTLHVISLDVQFANGRTNGEQIFFQDGAGFQQGHGRGRGAEGLGRGTTAKGLFVVCFVAGALPVTIVPPRSARPLKTSMTSAGSSHIIEA